jgi:hypothetical protein
MMTWRIFFVLKFFSRLLQFSFSFEKFSQSSSTRESNFDFCFEDIFFSTFRRLFFAFLMNCCLYLSKQRIDFDTTKKKFFFLCSFHFCFWKKRCFQSTLIFRDLDSRSWACFWRDLILVISTTRRIVDEIVFIKLMFNFKI